MGMISWFRYVPYGDLLLAMVYGWQPIADLGDSHGQYAVLCQWKAEGKHEKIKGLPSEGDRGLAGVAEVGPAPSRSSVAGWSWQDAGGR
jgi:hypothetical protein